MLRDFHVDGRVLKSLIIEKRQRGYEGIADTAVAAEEHDWDWVRETLETQDSAANKPEMVTD